MSLRATVAVTQFAPATKLISSVVGTLKLGGVDAPTSNTGTINPAAITSQSNREKTDLALYLDRSVWRNDDVESRDLVMRHVRQPILLVQ